MFLSCRAIQRNEAGVLWSLFNHALITLNSWRKLLLSLTLVFPLSFGGGKTWIAAMDRKRVRGLEDWVLLLPLAEGRGLWAKWPLGREGTPTPVTSSYCGFEILPEVRSSGKSLGACEGQRGKIRTRLFAGRRMWGEGNKFQDHKATVTEEGEEIPPH